MKEFSILLCLAVSLNLRSSHGEERRGRTFVDLGYSLSSTTIVYPGVKSFALNRDYEEWRFNGSFWYSSFSFCMGEHGGTHLDAPYHFHKNGWTLDQIPQSHLIDVPTTIVDVHSKIEISDDYPLASPGGTFKLSVGDLMDHEKEFGKIPPRSLLLLYTGWSRFWPNRINYLGYEEQGSKFTLRFPSVSVEALKWLAEERKIVGIGLDTPSLDGADEMNPSHVYGASQQIYNLKSVANLHLVVAKEKRDGMRAFVLPLKIVGGTGAPVRILLEMD